ncbi:DUF732 domain-containing protein [Leifsonia sp. NPDC056824]|uniref:DUF732 domain-containing protein n=1 Tax=Leifsonia sp. NPDC056824 TaxID=3345953 RepID=UPI00369A72E5
MLAFVCLTILSGCAANTGAGDRPLTGAEKDKMFVSLVRAAAAHDLPGTDDQLVEAGHKWCDALKAGSTSQELIDASAEGGSARDDIEVLDRLSKSVYCPQFD